MNVEEPTLWGSEFSLSDVAPERPVAEEARPVEGVPERHRLRDSWLYEQYRLLSFEKHEESAAYSMNESQSS